MEKVNSNFDFSIIDKILFTLDEDHSSSTLSKLKSEINRFFYKAKCKEILYTMNTDKLFFGMRVYPVINGNDAIELLGDSKIKPFNSYYIEFDSKLFDPMLGLEDKELTAILLHEIGHIVYDVGTIDEVKKHVDMYFYNTDTTVDFKPTYRELLAYALKDTVMKAASLFTKFGNEEMIADTFVASCGYGPYLETGFRKILRSSTYMNKDVDDRFITLSWVLRLDTDLLVRRLPAIKTLNKAKTLTASQLEKREIEYAVNKLAHLDSVHEGAIDNVRSRFSKKFDNFKLKGINSIKNDVYELNLRLRTAETPEDLMYIIRMCNSSIAILQDYLSEDISDRETESVNAALQELYSIRQKAAKDQKVRGKYDSLIQVVYPDLS